MMNYIHFALGLMLGVAGAGLAYHFHVATRLEKMISEMHSIKNKMPAKKEKAATKK